MIAVGARVRLVRADGADGSQLKERVGQVGVVETVRTTGQKTEVEVAFGPHWATGSGAWRTRSPAARFQIRATSRKWRTAAACSTATALGRPVEPEV